MYLSQRHVALGLQVSVNIGFAAVIVLDALGGYSPILTQFRVVGLAIAIVALIAYWRGWRYAPMVIVPLSVVITAFACADGHYDATNAIAFMIPPLFAVVLGRSTWVVGAALITPALTILISGSAEWNDRPIFFVLYAMVTIGIALSRQIFDTLAQQASAARRRAEESQAQAEKQSAALAAANVAQQAQLDEQQRLLDLVATLETPTVTLAEGVLFAPVVGHLDTRRSAALTTRLLEAAYAGRARHVILDISGVAAVDTAVAKTLLDTAHSLRLLGCRVILSGISSQVALTLTQQGVSLDELTTVRSPQEALARL